MARLFLGACFCPDCGFITERLNRAIALAAPPLAKETTHCPRCETKLQPVTLKDIRTEEALLDAAAHFLKKTRTELTEAWLNTTWNAKIPSARFHARDFCPEVLIAVSKYWMELVHHRGLDKLPHLWMTGPDWRYVRPSIFVIDANLGWPFGDCWVSEVTYSLGGRNKKSGYLAWVENGSKAWGKTGQRIKMWAVSTTQDRAVTALNERLDMMQREAAWKAELAYQANEAQAHAAATELEGIQL